MPDRSVATGRGAGACVAGKGLVVGMLVAAVAGTAGGAGGAAAADVVGVARVVMAGAGDATGAAGFEAIIEMTCGDFQ